MRLNTLSRTYTYSSLTGYEPRSSSNQIPIVILEHLNTLLSRVNLSMPFPNRLQFDKQWDFTIPIVLCTFLGLAAHIDLLVRVMIFWNLLNRNFNTFIAQLTFTSHDESWENLFVDIHIDRQRSDWVNPTPGRSPYSDTLQYIRNQRSHPDAPQEPHEDTSDEELSAAEETNPALPQTEAEVRIPIPGPPNYRTSETFHHERNLRVPPMPDTLASLFRDPPRREVVEDAVQIVPARAPAYDSWAHYFQQHPEMCTNWQSGSRTSIGTRPLQVRPWPRPFTPHPEPEVVDVSSNGSNSGDQEMEEMSHGDTVPNTPEHPTTPLEQMEEDDMRRLHPILPSNAALDAAGDNGILLTNEQHRVLMSQSEGSTILYRPREDQQQVGGDDPHLNISDEERGALRAAHDALQFAAGTEGQNADHGQPRITDLVRPEDPPILRAFAQELENWPEIDRFLEEAFWER